MLLAWQSGSTVIRNCLATANAAARFTLLRTIYRPADRLIAACINVTIIARAQYTLFRICYRYMFSATALAVSDI